MARQVISVPFASAGRRYFEVVLDQSNASEYAWVGVTDVEEPWPFSWGSNSLVWGSGGHTIETIEDFGRDARYDPNGSSFVKGDVLGVLVDFASKPGVVDVYFSRNGEWVFGGAPATQSNPANEFPLPQLTYRATAGTNGGPMSFSLRTRAAQLADRIPAGATAWAD